MVHCARRRRLRVVGAADQGPTPAARVVLVTQTLNYGRVFLGARRA